MLNINKFSLSLSPSVFKKFSNFWYNYPITRVGDRFVNKGSITRALNKEEKMIDPCINTSMLYTARLDGSSFGRKS